MKVWTPDVYAELKYKKFAAAVEVVTHQGTFESLETLPDSNDYGDVGGWKVRQWGFAGQIEQKLVEDRLKLGFYFGWASGDGDVEGLVPSAQVSDQIGDNKLETFRFHPGYRVDLILNRHILSRVQGSYYVKPMAQYDFIRKASGMKVGGRAEAIWTRASQFMQAPGHQRDLGIELDATVYFQSQDGALNKREDDYGGSFENRIRLLKEVVESVAGEVDSPDEDDYVELSEEELAAFTDEELEELVASGAIVFVDDEDDAADDDEDDDADEDEASRV